MQTIPIIIQHSTCMRAIKIPKARSGETNALPIARRCGLFFAKVPILS